MESQEECDKAEFEAFTLIFVFVNLLTEVQLRWNPCCRSHMFLPKHS